MCDSTASRQPVPGSTTLAEGLSRWHPARLWVAGLGAGYLRPAPGTWGSLAALGVWWFLLAESPAGVQLAVIAVYFVVSTVVLRPVMTACGVKDASWIVADEVAGQWLTLLGASQVWWIALAGFMLFRLFDIAKPWPVGWVDRRVPGALGVMLDDVVAGVMAWAVLQVAVPAIGHIAGLPAG